MIFSLRRSPMYPEKYVIKIDKEILGINNLSKKSNINVFPARLLGISYTKYLEFCSDILNAELVGKRQRFPIPLFEQTQEVYCFIKLLNTLSKLFLSYRNNPNTYIQTGNSIQKINLETLEAETVETDKI